MADMLNNWTWLVFTQLVCKDWLVGCRVLNRSMKIRFNGTIIPWDVVTSSRVWAYCWAGSPWVGWKQVGEPERIWWRHILSILLLFLFWEYDLGLCPFLYCWDLCPLFLGSLPSFGGNLSPLFVGSLPSFLAHPTGRHLSLSAQGSSFWLPPILQLNWWRCWMRVSPNLD